MTYVLRSNGNMVYYGNDNIFIPVFVASSCNQPVVLWSGNDWVAYLFVGGLP